MSTAPAPRVLVVEDDPGVIDVLSELLTREGYEVERANHGIDAIVRLTAAEEAPPQLVILDIGLPLESGVAVLEFIRSTMRSSLPVIVLTASVTPEQEAEIQRLGVNRLLRKPAATSLLLSAVAELIG